MHEYKTFIQRIGLTGVTNILIALSSLILIPILTKTLPVEEYGIWVMFMTTVSLVPHIVLLGLPFTMVRFLSSETKKSNRQEGFYSITLLVIISSSIASFLIVIFASYFSEILFNNNLNMVYVLSLVIFLSSLNGLFLNYFRTFQEIKKYSLFLLMQTYLSLIFISYFVTSGYGLFFATLGLLISYLIIFSIMILNIASKIGIKFPKFTNIKEYLTFGVPTVPNNLSYWIMDTADRYLIGLLLGLNFVGYYSPGYTLGYVIIMILAPFSILLPAVLPKYYDNNNLKKVNLYLRYSMKYFLLLAIPAFFILSILSKPILNIITTADIAANGYLITPFVAFSAILMGTYGIISNLIVLMKKTKVLAVFWILGSLLNICLNILFIPHFGLLGAAFVTVIAYLVVFIITVYYTSRYFDFDFDLLFILKSIIAASLSSISLFLINPNGIINVIITSFVFFTIYLFLILVFKGIKKEELSLFKIYS